MLDDEGGIADGILEDERLDEERLDDGTVDVGIVDDEVGELEEGDKEAVLFRVPVVDVKVDVLVKLLVPEARVLVARMLLRLAIREASSIREAVFAGSM